MKLLSCYIENFGRFSKFSHQFINGLNVFEEANGWGKSTLAVFIKAMFYGLPFSRTTDIHENERRRYAPWQGGVFGGSLSFTVDGRSYRVERIFGQKESEDDFRLFSIDTGTPSDDYTENLGEELFGIDAAGYERSTYFSQRPLAEKTNYSGIQSKLADHEDLTDFDRAIELLEKRRRFYRMTGNRGRIAELDQEILLWQEKLEAAEEDRAAYERLTLEIGSCQSTHAALRKESEHFASQASAAALLRENLLLSETARGLREGLSRAEIARDAILETVGTPVPTEHDTLQMLRLSEELDRKSAELAAKHQRRAMQKKVLSIVPAVGTLLSVLLAVLLPLYILLAPAGLCLVGTVLLLLPGAPKARNTELEVRIAQRRAFLAQLAPIERDMSLPTETARLTALLERLRSLARAEGVVEAAKDAVRRFSDEHPDLIPVSAKDAEESDPAALREKQQRIDSEAHKLEGQLIEMRQRASELAASAEEIPGIRETLERLRRERADAAVRCSAILKAEQFLEEAKSALVTRYRDDVECGFRDYLVILEDASDGSLGTDISVSGSFDVAIINGGATRDPAAYSAGYRDLIALCLRFALTDALFRHEAPVMVLDDPFVNLDDAKTEAAMRLLTRLAERRQILYFTCSAVRNPLE